MNSVVLALCLLLPASQAIAQATVPPVAASENTAQIEFITCPIYRDTDSGPKSGCWLADDHETGQRFDVSLAPTKPDWNFAVLVEGNMDTKAADACGGVVLNPVRVSVLQDSHCARAMIGAESYTGHVYHLPVRNMRPLYEKRAPFATPYTTRDFAIPFDYGHAFLTYQLADYYIDQAVAYALATDAKTVTITGWADTDPRRVSGQLLHEPPAVAQQRAALVASWMRGLGVPAGRLRILAKTGAEAADIPGADGLTAPSRRRADIAVVPGRSGP